MEELRITGVINSTSQELVANLSTRDILVGDLNIYTMETGDGREIELCVVDEYICWRRVGDITWIQLIPLVELKGEAPVRGIDYWTIEDQNTIIERINLAVGGNIHHSSLLDREEADQHTISSITGLTERLDSIIQDKYLLYRQSIASSVWTIQHNLDKMPTVFVKDSSGNSVIGEIDYQDTNTVIINFSGSFSGIAYLN